MQNDDAANSAKATLTTILLDPSGKEVARKEDSQTIAAGAAASFAQNLSLPTAQLWSCDTPVLYHAVSEVRVGGKRIARLASTLTRGEAEEAGRIIRQAPVLVETCREASRRLAKAQHPNAKALRALIHGALQGLELPLDDHVTDRIDA